MDQAMPLVSDISGCAGRQTETPHTRPRLLFVTTRFMFPVVGGDLLRPFHICQELSKRFDITLVSLCANKADLTADYDRSVFAEVHRFYLPRWKSLLQVVAGLFRKRPLQVSYYAHAEASRFLRTVWRQYDHGISHLIRGAALVGEVDERWLLEMTDSFALSYLRISRNQLRLNPLRWLYNEERRRLEYYEREMVRRYRAVVVISSADANHVGRSQHLHVVPNGVDLMRLGADDHLKLESRGRTILFIGKMDYSPNFEACRYFIREILPALPKEITFKIVGKSSDRALRRLTRGNPRVSATGYVESIASAAEGVFCGVAPIRSGAGLPNKVLEYMALGLPTVASEMANMGMGTVHGHHLLVATSRSEWVQYVMQLYREPMLRHKYSANGWRYVSRHHSWGVIGQRYTDLIKREVNCG